MRRSDLYLTTRSRKGLRFESNQSVAETADLEAFIGLTKQFWDSNGGGLKRGKTSWASWDSGWFDRGSSWQ